jgi:hypothetical protein
LKFSTRNPCADQKLRAIVETTCKRNQLRVGDNAPQAGHATMHGMLSFQEDKLAAGFFRCQFLHICLSNERISQTQ